MEMHHQLNPKVWWTMGRVFKDKLICQYQRSGTSSGVWYGDNPLNYPTAVILLEISIIVMLSRGIYFILQPLRQMLWEEDVESGHGSESMLQAGLLLGRTFLIQNHQLITTLFPPPARYILKTIAGFGFMLQMFISGVMIDISAIRKAGAKSILIALSGLIFSLSLGALAFLLVRQMIELDQSLYTGIRILIVFNSLTFFMVTSGYLHELKITNSEIGRLAASSSLAIDIFGLLTTTFGLIWLSPLPNSPPKWISTISISMFYFTLFCVFRPLVLFIVRKTPEGMPMKQSHFLSVLVIIMFAWHWSERIGQRFAAFLLGLSLPHGPPLGSALVQKLQLFTSGILLPLFYTMAGWRMNLNSWKDTPSVWIVELIIVLGQFGKFMGTIVSSMAVGVSLEDALPLGFIMTFKGIMEIATFSVWFDQTLLDDRLFTLAMVNIIIFTGLAYPLVQWLYDPSDKYNTVRKRKVMGLGEHGDFQLLVCIHNEDSIPAIFDFLEVSRSNGVGGSMAVFVLQLIQLSGSAIPVLAPLHQYKNTAGNNFALYEHAQKAFEKFEQESNGYTRVQQFVSVTPYKTMHDDICALAHDKRTSLIVVPFHKKWGVDGQVESSNQQIRSINRRVLRKSPCSVAILIDRGAADQSGGISSLHNNTSKSNTLTYHIVMPFIGGTDDHEALALARRMAEHPSVRLTVIWLKADEFEPRAAQDIQEDLRVMTDFHMRSKGHDRITVREVVVQDGIGTTKALLSVQNVADLVVVGRYHEAECPAIQGLADWNESPEIGALADTLVTSDARFSILVVQQQPRIDWKLNTSRQSRDDEFVSVSLDSPRSSFTSSIRSHMSFDRK
ncbi:Cation/H(+) antiporter 14 [Bienertia sinuspersici]